MGRAFLLFLSCLYWAFLVGMHWGNMNMTGNGLDFLRNGIGGFWKEGKTERGNPDWDRLDQAWEDWAWAY